MTVEGPYNYARERYDAARYRGSDELYSPGDDRPSASDLAYDAQLDQEERDR
jgi:hypothetical protein